MALKGVIERPVGFEYRADFISPAEEADLIGWLEQVNFKPFRYYEYKAKRQVKSYGYSYSFDASALRPTEPLPQQLAVLGERMESWANLPAGALVQSSLTLYEPGAPIGWHRDAPPFGTVVGLSLAGSCVMQFQDRRQDLRYVFEQPLEPGSAYILSGPARYRWQHHIPPLKARRYSITFRTLKH